MSRINPLLTMVNQSAPKRGKQMFRGFAALAVLMAALTSLTPAQAQGPAYQVISNDPNGLEVRFRGMPIRGVHADDNQNALSIDFAQPVDGAAFDRLSGDLPQWISMAYANFDNGVIRSNRPVTFLTRNESDGFSLRIVPRGAPSSPRCPPQQMAQAAPPPNYPPPGPYAQQQHLSGAAPALCAAASRLCRFPLLRRICPAARL